MNTDQRRAGAVFAAACAALLTIGVVAPATRGAGAAQPGRIVLPQEVPHLPAGTQQLGAAPAGQVLDLDVVLAGQNASGLDQAVAAVSTPGSPQYRHYLTPAQYRGDLRPRSVGGGAGVGHAAQRRPDRGHARPRQHVAAGARHRLGGVGRARYPFGVGAGTR